MPQDLTPKYPIISFEEEVVISPLTEGLGATIGGVVGGRLATTVAEAINSSGNLVNDVINVNLDTESKTLLKDFTFGSTDYSGAFKTGDITWDVSTGEITGGSGAVFYKGGLIFASAGVATITLNGTTGSAKFAGILSAASGTLGTITAGLLYMQTVTATARTIDIMNAGATVFTGIHISVAVNNSSSTGECFEGINYGTGLVADFLATGGGKGVRITKQTGTAATALEINQATNARGIDIQKTGTGEGTALNIQNSGTGSSLYITQTISSAGSAAAVIVSANNSSSALYVSQQGDVTNVPAIYGEKSSGGGTGPVAQFVNYKTINSFPVLALTNSSPTSTNFNKMITMGGVGSASIWISNGTTPQGNLSGVAGDICLGGDSGNIYRCTGTTNWTAM